MDHPHIALVKRYLDAAQQQDFAKAASFFTTDFEYVVPGRNTLSGTYHAPSAALDYFGKLMALTKGSYTITEMVEWLVSDTGVVLIAKEKFAINGKEINWTRVIWFTVKDEQFARVELFESDQYGVDETLSGS
jgi:ketosteroid isomerase-like protein